jgi:hypothetical protein
VGVASVYDYFGDKRAVMGELGERLLRSKIDASESTYDGLSRRDERDGDHAARAAANAVCTSARAG